MTQAANILVADAYVTRSARGASPRRALASGSPSTAPRGKHFRQPGNQGDQSGQGKPTSAASVSGRGRERRASAEETNRLRVVPAPAAPATAATTAAPAATPAPTRASTPTARAHSARPTADQLRSELARERRVRRAVSVTRSTVYALVVVAAAAVLVATFFFPVFRIYGTSMNPTFSEGDIVVAVSCSSSDLSAGDPVVFYYENKVLVKRFIASAGQWVDIDDDGNVYVDGELLDEPYVSELALGECDIEFPYQVPDGRIFVLGDNRATSVDSRSSTVGCVSEEQLVGKIVFRVWPLSGFGTV